jgi:cytochrome bd ubiquinol oxidase subunit II
MRRASGAERGDAAVFDEDVVEGDDRLAVGALASIVWAWGVAQWSYIPTSLSVSAAAAASAALATMLVVFGVATVLILPPFALLYVLDQRSLL